jgi:hypothetical protein
LANAEQDADDARQRQRTAHQQQRRGQALGHDVGDGAAVHERLAEVAADHARHVSQQLLG